MKIDKFIRQYESDQSLENGLLVAKELRRLDRIEEIGLYLSLEAMYQYGFISKVDYSILEQIKPYPRVSSLMFMKDKHHELSRMAVPFIMETLLNSDDAIIREAALNALIEIAPHMAHHILLRAFRKETDRTILQALESQIDALGMKKPKVYYNVSRSRAHIPRGILPKKGYRGIGRKRDIRRKMVILFKSLDDLLASRWLHFTLRETRHSTPTLSFFKIILPDDFPLLSSIHRWHPDIPLYLSLNTIPLEYISELTWRDDECPSINL